MMRLEVGEGRNKSVVLLAVNVCIDLCLYSWSSGSLVCLDTVLKGWAGNPGTSSKWLQKSRSGSTEGPNHSPGKAVSMQPRGRARKGNVSLPKAAADGGASLSGQPMTLREPFGKVVGRKCLAARMLEAALGWRDSGLQQRWLVGQITIWWAECCPPCFTDREEQVPVGERNSPWRDLTDTIDSPLCSEDSMESCKSPVPIWKSGRSQYLLHCHHVESKSIHLKQNRGLPRIAQGVLWVGDGYCSFCILDPKHLPIYLGRWHSAVLQI